MSHTPKRTRKRVSPSPDVAQGAGTGGYCGAAAAGRTWGVSEQRPTNVSRPATRGDRR